MPHIRRSGRSLLALALVVNLVAAGAPLAALGRQPAQIVAEPSVAAAAGAARLGISARHDLASRSATVDAVRLGVAFRAVAAPTPRSDTAWTGRAGTKTPSPKVQTMSAVEAAGGGSASGSDLRGRNHVWIPALGVDRAVSFFSCSSSAYPGNLVYRWGCAGGNNVYLFGHAHSVFKPLHDAYVRGRLAKGMQLHYADANGKVSTYAVSWWKVTTPDKGAWAYARQSRPSLTLQTCVGAKSQYRLIVRLTKVG
jgi:hypothetical protein